MINYKEARAGNLVMYDNRLFQIESISRSLPCLNTDEFGIGVVDWNNIQPISLTPEILEKCGFAFKPTGEEVYEQIWSIDGFEIWEHDSGFCHDFHYGGDVKHLHQLQNLYFALCGEELNYTP